MQDLDVLSEPKYKVHKNKSLVNKNTIPAQLMHCQRALNCNSLLEGGQIRVASGGARVVDEGQVLRNVSVRPIGEEQVQQSLVATVKASLFHGKVQELSVSVHVGFVHKHSGVEAVWPADIRGSRQLLPLKELIGVLQDLSGGIVTRS